MQLTIDDDFKNLLPDLTSEEYTELEKDVVKHGILNPIITWNGTIVDGHNRYAIAQAHRIQAFPTREISFDSKSEAMQWIITHQMARRNLTKSQLVVAYSKYEEEKAKEAKAEMSKYYGNQYESGPTSNLMQVQKDNKRNPTVAAEVAKKIGVSENTYRDMKLIVEKGAPEQIERMNTGGKGNGVSKIAKEIKDRDKPKIKCTACGVEYPADYFAGGRQQCKYCRDKIKHGQLRDVKGDIIQSTGEFDNVSDEEIIGEIYSRGSAEITIEDVIEEFTVNFESYLVNLKRILETHASVIKENKNKIATVLGEASLTFAELKERYE